MIENAVLTRGGAIIDSICYLLTAFVIVWVKDHGVSDLMIMPPTVVVLIIVVLRETSDVLSVVIIFVIPEFFPLWAFPPFLDDTFFHFAGFNFPHPHFKCSPTHLIFPCSCMINFVEQDFPCLLNGEFCTIRNCLGNCKISEINDSKIVSFQRLPFCAMFLEFLPPL